MKLSGIRKGDLVLGDVRGTRFYALVSRDATNGEVWIEPLHPGFGYHMLTARQVIAHWSKRAGRRDA